MYSIRDTITCLFILEAPAQLSPTVPRLLEHKYQATVHPDHGVVWKRTEAPYSVPAASQVLCVPSAPSQPKHRLRARAFKAPDHQ
jgi:hypothetical protein